MKIALLTIGDELLNGDLADTNTATICHALSKVALTAREAATIGDNEDNIGKALQRLCDDNDAVIVTGGLGPTTDDRTAKAAAKAFSRSLSLNDQALQQIRARFRMMRREMHPANEKQAMLPSRSSVIANRKGTAPGFQIQHNGTDFFFLPGVPSEMLTMLEETVVPFLLGTLAVVPELARRDIIIFGLPEPEVESRLNLCALPEDVEIAFNVEFPIVIIKLKSTEEHSHQRIDRAELAIRKTFGDYVVGLDNETLSGETCRHLTAAGLTISLAESCTGGLIAKLLTDNAGASSFLERSVVTYANSAKTSCLNVPEILLERHGAVSPECASAMARGVKAVSRTDVGLSVTGIAGPDGGTAEKPVGTVFMSIIGPGIDRTEQFHFPGTRDQVRLRTACTALDWLRRYAINQINRSNGS